MKLKPLTTDQVAALRAAVAMAEEMRGMYKECLPEFDAMMKKMKSALRDLRTSQATLRKTTAAEREVLVELILERKAARPARCHEDK